jgi:hypothetical protein
MALVHNLFIQKLDSLKLHMISNKKTIAVSAIAIAGVIAVFAVTPFVIAQEAQAFGFGGGFGRFGGFHRGFGFGGFHRGFGFGGFGGGFGFPGWGWGGGWGGCGGCCGGCGCGGWGW